MNVIFIGIAGSGKSTMVRNFSKWLTRRNYAVKAVNLDPACDSLEYDAVFDIRKLFTIREIMRKYGLGPNGATTKAISLLRRNFSKLPSVKADYVLYDAPGQVESFVFSEDGRSIMEKLGSTIVFLVDCGMNKEQDILAQLMLFVAVSLQTNTRCLLVFNKSDVLSTVDRKRIEGIMQGEVARPEGSIAEIVETLSKVLPGMIKQRAIFVSSLNGQGFDDLSDALKEIFCSCGDMT